MDNKRTLVTTLLAIIGLCFVVPLFAAEVDFTLAIPSGWKQRPQSTALAQYKKGPGSFIVTADTMPPNANTPDAYVEFAKEQLGKTLKGAAFMPVVAGKKDSNETRELIYTAEAYNIKMKYDVLYVFRKDKAYTLTGATMTDFFDASFAADIKTFFTSFKFK